MSLETTLKWQREILEDTKRMLVVERESADHNHAPAIRQIITNVDAALLFNKELNENLFPDRLKVGQVNEEAGPEAGESVPA